MTLLLCQLLLLSVITGSGNEVIGSNAVDLNSSATRALSNSAAFNITFYGRLPLTFNHTQFLPGQTDSFPAGFYTAQAEIGIVGDYPCHAGFVFSNWNWTGYLSVIDPNSRTTNVTVTGNGTLTALYHDVSLCTPVSPLSIFTTLIAVLAVATLIKTKRRDTVLKQRSFKSLERRKDSSSQAWSSSV